MQRVKLVAVGLLPRRAQGGFCLWNSSFCGGYDIKATPHKVDVVGSFVKSCRKYGIRPCFYVGPNANGFLTYELGVSEEKFMEMQLGQFREMLTKYGPIARLWYAEKSNCERCGIATA